MKKPTDAEIVELYNYDSTVLLDEEGEDEINCSRCGKRSTTPRTAVNVWHRMPNKATHLRALLELCDECNEAIIQMKSLGR